MNTRLSDLKNAVETMSKSDFNDYLIRLIENIEQTLANSSIYEDMEEKILFDKFYLFSLQIQDLDLSLHECKQNQLKIKSQIEQLKKESNKKLTTEQHTLSNHIEEIKNTLTDGCILPNLTNEDISKILVKIKKEGINISFIEYIRDVISNLNYQTTSQPFYYFINHVIRIKAGEVKKHIESIKKTLEYIDNQLKPLLTNIEDTKIKIEEYRNENIKHIQCENMWKELLNYFFKFEYIPDTSYKNVLFL